MGMAGRFLRLKFIIIFFNNLSMWMLRNRGMSLELS